MTTGTDGLHVSLDVDCADPRTAPDVGTPVASGLTVRDAHLIMELVAEGGRMVSCEVAEMGPVVDQRNSTAELAAGLIASTFGKTIF